MGAILSIDQMDPRPDVLHAAASVLRAEGVLVMPTDSVYGIGCAATPGNPAHERIFEIKQRDRTQTLPWLVADAHDLEIFGAEVPAWMVDLAERHWPGALTLVVKAGDKVPQEYRAADGTIALRVPDSEFVRALVREVGPLATTSANTHGKAAAVSGIAVEARIVELADLTIDAGPAPVGEASTIVGCKDGRPVVYRQGALDLTALFPDGLASNLS